MNRAITVWTNDLQNTMRDKTISVLLFVPFIFVALLRFGVPQIERLAPVVHEHRPVILALFCQLAGMFPAFMMSFLMLDEKDENLFVVFRVLPMSPRRFLLYRLLPVAALSFLYSLLIIIGTGLVEYAPVTVLMLACLCAVLSPTATLIAVSVAGNKIEGLTIIKGLFFLMGVPAVAFAVQLSWKIAFAIFPAYWIYSTFAAADNAALACNFAGALLFHAVLVAVFYRRFRRVVFP